MQMAAAFLMLCLGILMIVIAVVIPGLARNYVDLHRAQKQPPGQKPIITGPKVCFSPEEWNQLSTRYEVLPYNNNSPAQPQILAR